MISCVCVCSHETVNVLTVLFVCGHGVDLRGQVKVLVCSKQVLGRV